jgi:16S rRNA (uracil1498-N3)-methyltransferase
MARKRRFYLESLHGLDVGASVVLPDEEAKHARVLRLVAGDEVELFDRLGNSADGTLNDPATWSVTLTRVNADAPTEQRTRLIIATAWPKGKRAAVLVEKSAELGVDLIVPVNFDRSVVEKDNESEGVERLRRIAAEAAKQSGRTSVPDIGAAVSLKELLEMFETETAIALLDPRAAKKIGEWHASIQINKPSAILLIVGPEGGFSREELDLIDERTIARVLLGKNILRVETAALAACAIIAALS